MQSGFASGQVDVGLWEIAGAIMKNREIKNKCRSIRGRMAERLLKSSAMGDSWLLSHISQCPKCQKRLAGIGRVDLAISLIKSQVHSTELLKRANAKAISTLNHTLRGDVKAEKLRHYENKPSWGVRNSRAISSITSAAACIAIVLLLKTGIFSSMEDFQAQGTDALRQHYARHLGEDMTKDIFKI